MKLRTILFTLCCMQISAMYGMVKTKHQTNVTAQEYIAAGLWHRNEGNLLTALVSFRFAEKKTSDVRIKADANFQIGLLYYLGGKCVRKNHMTALKYLEPVAHQVENPEALARAWLIIGCIHLEGDKSLAQNLEAAHAYLKVASEQDSELAVQKCAWEILQEYKDKFTHINGSLAEKLYLDIMKCIQDCFSCSVQ